MPSIADQQPLYEIKADLFKGLAHPFRIRILELLSEAHHHSQAEPLMAEPDAALASEAEAGVDSGATADAPAVSAAEAAAEAGEMSVAVLLRETGLEASHLSQHLAVLRRHRLVESQRRGSHVYYRLLHSRVADMLAVVRSLVLDTLAADETLLAEAEALPRLPTAPLQERERS